MRTFHGWFIVAAGFGSLLTPADAQALAPPCVTVRAERIIDAPYDLVFATIVDTASYPDWNPYVLEVTPNEIDVTVVGAKFVLTVDQPFELFHTQSPETTVDVMLPDGDEALLVYGYDDPLLAPLVGNPERIQRVQARGRNRTYYETVETFCTYLLPLLPLASVQAGFSLQAAALEVEAEARFRAAQ